MSIDTFAKSLWTDAEFDQISFHDNRVYAHAVLLEEYAFLLDIDYIVEWLHPSAGNNAYSFRVSPATLRFENIFNLKVNFELGNVFEMDILNLTRTALGRTPNGRFAKWHFAFELLNGTIELESTGFSLCLRSAPRHVEGQSLTLEERGGISVSMEPYAA